MFGVFLRGGGGLGVLNVCPDVGSVAGFGISGDNCHYSKTLRWRSARVGAVEEY